MQRDADNRAWKVVQGDVSLHDAVDYPFDGAFINAGSRAGCSGSARIWRWRTAARNRSDGGSDALLHSGDGGKNVTRAGEEEQDGKCEEPRWWRKLISRYCCVSFDKRKTDHRLTMVFNLGKIDRSARIVLGLAIGLAGILTSGHPYVGRALGFLGALVILSGGLRKLTCLSPARSEQQQETAEVIPNGRSDSLIVQRVVITSAARDLLFLAALRLCPTPWS